MHVLVSLRLLDPYIVMIYWYLGESSKVQVKHWRDIMYNQIPLLAHARLAQLVKRW